MTDKMGFDVRNHHLVCNHSKASEAEKEALLKRYNIIIRDLPKILRQDPAIAALNPVEGDVIKIERISKTAGKTEYYRQVIES
ncbi:MAG: DNA-directed RNA polymerase subunit H [Nanoarchaeota archaeon]